MDKNSTITAVIPVRAGSRRLPNKNILPFGDSNLLVHKIRQLKQVKGLDTIIVSSDSDEMLEMARCEALHTGGGGISLVEIITHRRAPEYCDECTKSFNDVVEHIASSVTGDAIMWAPCVCPLTSIESYENAILKYRDLVVKKQEYDSVISAKLFKEYLFDENGPLNWNPAKHVPSQNLPEWKTIVNGFYIAPRKDMIQWRYLYGHNPYLFTLNKKEAVDIDDAEDFEVAKALLRRESNGRT